MLGLNLLDFVVEDNIFSGGEEIDGGFPTLLTEDKLKLRKRIKGINSKIPMEYIINIFKSKMFEYGGESKCISDLVWLVEAKTGSGKSTTMPVELFRILKHSDEVSVLVTQPKVLTAVDIPTNQVSKQSWAMDMILGKNLSYATGSLKMKAEERSYLQYSTVGLLVRIFQTNTDEDIIKKYRIIILDEVHQRDVELDIVMMYIKRFLQRNQENKRCPLIILTSATFDVDRYAKYFGLNDENIISVSGAVFDIEDHFIEKDSTDFISTVADIVEIICNFSLPQKINGVEIIGKDILIFLPGADYRLPGKLKRLNEKLKQNGKGMFIVLTISAPVINTEGLHKRLIHYDYKDIKINEEQDYSPTGKYSIIRRVIISTSVAETGLTLNDLGYVIDTGFDRKSESYPPFNIAALTTKPATLANVIQRRGRVGRLFPGKFFGVYTKETYNALKTIKLPSIITDKTDNLLLKIMAENENFEMEKMDMFDPPPIESFKQSLELSIILGYINQYPKLHLTDLGKMYIKTVKVDMNWFRVIISAYAYGIYIQDIISMMVMADKRTSDYLNKQVLFPELFKELNINCPVDTYEQFKILTVDDFIEDTFIFSLFESYIQNVEPDNIFDKCKKIGINFKEMMNINKDRLELIEEIAKLQLNPYMYKENSLLNTSKGDYLFRISTIKKCLYDGFLTNMLYKKEDYYISRFGIKTNVLGKYPTMSQSIIADLESVGKVVPPEYIITNRFTLKEDKKSETYKFIIKSGKISVLDGYVNIDKRLLDPQYI